jgi:hypothetical protein
LIIKKCGRTIFKSFPELSLKEISYDRINFEFKASKKPGTTLATQLHPSGNAYVCAKYIDDTTGYQVDWRGWVKIKDFNEDQLREIIRKALLRCQSKLRSPKCTLFKVLIYFLVYVIIFLEHEQVHLTIFFNFIFGR